MKTHSVPLVLVLVGLAALAAIGATYNATIEAIEPQTHYPEPDFIHKGHDRTCMIYGVEDSNIQYWQCSDGCEYIGFWKIDVTKHLTCPDD